MHARYVPKLSRNEMERRRLRAADDLEAGDLTQIEIAQKYGVHQSNVARWQATLRTDGRDGLRRSNPPGAAPKLEDEQWVILGDILVAGAAAYGFETDLWTGPRVKRVIEERFGVSYNEKYVTEILHNRFNMTWQKPRRVPRERNEEARREWLANTWEDIKGGRSAASTSSSSSTRAAFR